MNVLDESGADLVREHRGHGDLWIGPRPPLGEAVARANIHVLVLSAIEIQPAAPLFPGVEVIHAPLNDDGSAMTAAEFAIAKVAAACVVRRIRAGKNVLVTCAQGRNRSGLIVALALQGLDGISGREAMTVVQRCRVGALANPWFQDALDAQRSRLRVVQGGKTVATVEPQPSYRCTSPNRPRRSP